MSSGPTIAEQLRDKRVGVCLASGFFGFYHQAGVLAALEERGITPARLTGTSAGALTAALYASGLEMERIRDDLVAMKRQTFWDVHVPFTRLGFGALAGKKFQAELARVLAVHSFESCRIPLDVGVYDIDEGRVAYFNEGALVPAVYASCAVPYMFTPAEIDGRRYWDGGFGEKCAMVPFLTGPKVDVVLVSYIPRRSDTRRDRPKKGLLSFMPPITAIFANTPYEERQERDQQSLKVLRESGLETLVFAPERVWLGPFSMNRGGASYEQAREGALRILDSTGDGLLGCPQLA